jgi:hypothetical protein
VNCYRTARCKCRPIESRLRTPLVRANYRYIADGRAKVIANRYDLATGTHFDSSHRAQYPVAANRREW